MPKKPFYKRFWIRLAAAVVLGAVLFFALKVPILQAMGNYLRSEDTPQKTKYLFVLSGGAFDRGHEAARLYKAGLVDTLVVTGANVHQNLRVLGIEINEAQLTDSALVSFGVPQERILLIPKGTSTIEEAGIIHDFCLKKGQVRATVLSDKFHTGRAKKLIRPVLDKDGIQLTMLGSPSSEYNEDRWWESENGLIMVNNEYAKSLYYLLN
jgi:uncharacterized SAM-binding protein YcdF (DUF218 family)